MHMKIHEMQGIRRQNYMIKLIVWTYGYKREV